MNFAVTGIAGFVADRHLKAIQDVGHRLVAAVDPHDSVGMLDRYSFDVRFFTEIERFDRHLEKLRRGSEEHRVHYLSICSPNYLHDAHVRLALRVGAHAICEKPLVINPWNLDALQELESESASRVYTVLQLRLHPTLMRLRSALLDKPGHHDVSLTYLTARGPWYDVSWKGSIERSGGIAANIGIHFFDLLLWLFGPVETMEVHLREAKRAGGCLELRRATVKWFLSTDPRDLSSQPGAAAPAMFRSIVVDGEEVVFTEGISDLHTRVYQEVLAGAGLGIAEARPSIELAYLIRQAPVVVPKESAHPMVSRS
jgi:UDP-N-acetyl-2-amino-2-deoxyglucuronate dehydrogenase